MKNIVVPLVKINAVDLQLCTIINSCQKSIKPLYSLWYRSAVGLEDLHGEMSTSVAQL